VAHLRFRPASSVRENGFVGSPQIGPEQRSPQPPNSSSGFLVSWRGPERRNRAHMDVAVIDVPAVGVSTAGGHGPMIAPNKRDWKPVDVGSLPQGHTTARVRLNREQLRNDSGARDL
jgi:hypothetical protein